MVYILVNGTKVIAWNEEPIEGDGIPFEIADDVWPGSPAEGMTWHWDGRDWWQEADAFNPTEVLAAILLNTPEIIDNLPDNDIAHMAPYIQDWAPDTPYVTGDIRAYGNLVASHLAGIMEPERCSFTVGQDPRWSGRRGRRLGAARLYEPVHEGQPRVLADRGRLGLRVRH